MFMNIHIDYFMNLLMKISYTFVHEITTKCSWMSLDEFLFVLIHESFMNVHDELIIHENFMKTDHGHFMKS